MAVTPVKERGYAHPEKLAETDWLAEHLQDPAVRIIDARPAPQYNAGHIPGAVNLSGFGGIPRAENDDMAEPAEFARIAGQLGIGDTTEVVVYDAPSQQMGMVAWSFLYYGHTAIRLLDGGFAKWTAEDRSVATEPSTYPPAVFHARPAADVYCSLESAKASLGQPETVFWDTRSLAEYEGTATAGFGGPLPRPGRIPGAVHLEWTELLDPLSKTFKTAAELRELLYARGIMPEVVVHTY
jgi:thiosulfate/3-mercaptopyruvate sulfurtransferase